MLLPFRNVMRSAEHDWLVTGAPLMVGEALGQFQDLIVVPEEVLAAARNRLGIATDATPNATQLGRLAEETGGWTAVVGNIFATATGVRLSAQALDVPTSRVLVRAETAIPADADVRDSVNRLSLRLLEPTGVRGTMQAHVAFTTKSIDAYRAYARGIAALQRSQYRDALNAFSEAVKLDSTFALAWANLAMNTIILEGEEAIVNPLSNSYRFIEQAARLSDRMPERQARFIRAMQMFYRGEVTHSRRLIDSLTATDPNDLDAHLWLAFTELMTPLMDTTVNPARMVTSWNRSVAAVRHVLERDPARLSVYWIPAFAYGVAGGLWWGNISGVKREGGSFAALMTRADVVFIPVLRDTLEFMPRERFDSLPEVERTRLRRRAADAGREWVDRWLAAAPDDADAHLWASRFAELREDYAGALRELQIADSLGVQSGVESVAGRRLALLVKLRRYEDAGVFSDSLLRSGGLRSRPLSRQLDRRWLYATAALLLSKRWESASRFAEIIGPVTPGNATCTGLASELGFVNLVDRWVRLAIMDTVAMHFVSANATGLARCLESLATLIVDSTTLRRTVAARALQAAADSFYRTGIPAVAYRAARAAWNADTSRRSALLALPWFVERSKRLAVGRTFEALSAVLEGDSAVFTFRRTSSEPIEIDSPGLATNWQFGVNTFSPGDTTSFSAFLVHGRSPTDSASRGGVREMLAALTSIRAGQYFYNKPPVMTTPVALPTDDGFRVVVRGPVVAAMRAVRPREIRFVSGPCIAVNEGLCRQPRVAIEYR